MTNRQESLRKIDVFTVQADHFPDAHADGHHDLHDSAAKSYLKALAENKSALLVAPTWTEIEAVTEKVRAAMKTSGRLAGEERELQVFDSLSWTEAQKRDARQYRPGMAIHFHRTTHGFDKNETVSVVAVENDSIKVQREVGTERLFSLGAGSACFDVGEKRRLKIAAGDKLLLQANMAGKRFINGELVEVRAIQGDSVVLADGRVIPQNYRTFTHGYAVTSHAAQPGHGSRHSHRRRADDCALGVAFGSASACWMG